MNSVSRVRPKIGDVIEIQTPRGFAYAHYTHEHQRTPKYGALIRVLAGIHAARPELFENLVAQAPQFITFFPLGSACARRIVTIVGHEAIPCASQAFPLFRASMRTPKGYGPWWLWDGTKEWKVGRLEPGMEQLPIRGVINDTLLIERIVKGWRHEHEA